MPSIALPADGTVVEEVANSEATGFAPAAEPDGAPSGKLSVTAHQRAYLDALESSGLKPSTELLALRIGLYVCQATAAGQSPQAIWDFVEPLVSTDVQNADVVISPVVPTEAEIDAATYRYIRIATEQLC